MDVLAHQGTATQRRGYNKHLIPALKRRAIFITIIVVAHHAIILSPDADGTAAEKLSMF
jgi:hypothetical protein